MGWWAFLIKKIFSMKNFFVLLFFLGCAAVLQAQDIKGVLQEAEKLENALNEKGALEKYQLAVRMNPANLLALNKCSELCSRVGNRETTQKARFDYYQAAQTFASIALKIDPQNASANCMMAIALGRLSLEKSGKEKVKAAKEIKKYADLAVKNDPLNAKAWHVIGRWQYEVSNLSFVEKAAVKVLFGGMPKSSFKEAVAAFEKAKNLSPNFVINYLELAKAYKKNGEKAKARAAINTMLQLPNTTEDDEASKTNAKKLLKEME
jgi:tetratricopeptide (TPR) repeat protein